MLAVEVGSIMTEGLWTRSSGRQVQWWGGHRTLSMHYMTKEVKKGGEAAPNFKGGLLLRLHKTAAKHGEGANQQPAQPLLPLSLPLPTINRNPGLPHVVDALHMRTQICVTTCLTGASLGT